MNRRGPGTPVDPYMAVGYERGVDRELEPRLRPPSALGLVGVVDILSSPWTTSLLLLLAQSPPLVHALPRSEARVLNWRSPPLASLGWVNLKLPRVSGGEDNELGHPCNGHDVWSGQPPRVEMRTKVVIHHTSEYFSP